MRELAIILFIAFSALDCVSQDKHKAWLPEDYVKAAKANDSCSYQFLIPVEGFELIEGVLHVLTYRGEVNPIPTERVTLEGRERLKLVNLEYYINLKYNSRELSKRLSKATIYLQEDGDDLLLEIFEDGNINVIRFVDGTDGHIFKSIRDAKKHLQEKY